MFYLPIRAPSVNGVTFFNMIELVGRLPVKTLCGRIRSNCGPDIPDFSNSARASASDFPFANASV